MKLVASLRRDRRRRDNATTVTVFARYGAAAPSVLLTVPDAVTNPMFTARTVVRKEAMRQP